MGKTNRATYKLEEHTFGSRIEEVILIKNLKQFATPSQINRVCSIINHHRHVQRMIQFIPDESVRNELRIMIKKKSLSRLDNLKDLHPSVYSFGKNVITIHSRDFVKSKQRISIWKIFSETLWEKLYEW